MAECIAHGTPLSAQVSPRGTAATGPLALARVDVRPSSACFALVAAGGW
jgi:hypothetical protein